MVYLVMADLVVVVHLAFMVFVGAGSLLARRRPWLLWLHTPSLIWAVTSITIGLPCPLTTLEKLLRRWAGQSAYAGGFVDHYVEGVVYSEPLTPLLQAMAFVLIVAGYTRLHRSAATAVRSDPGALAAQVSTSCRGR